MKVYYRTCIKDAVIEALNGDRQEIRRGKEYTTSAEKDGMVTVFSTFWVKFPVDHFGPPTSSEERMRELQKI